MTAGAVPATVAALKAHCSVDAVAEQACRALWEIAATLAGKKASVAEGAVPAIVAALKAHPSEVAISASGALWYLAKDYPNGMSAVIAAGAVPLLTTVFASHDDEHARNMAHYALNELGYNDNGSKIN